MKKGVDKVQPISTVRHIALLDRSSAHTPFCILNRHLFIRLRLVAVDFVTLALVVNRGSWFRQLHANVTYMHHRSTWVIVLTKGIQFRQRLQHLDSGHGFRHEPVNFVNRTMN